jgi:hypothetical protein
VGKGYGEIEIVLEDAVRQLKRRRSVSRIVPAEPNTSAPA